MPDLLTVTRLGVTFSLSRFSRTSNVTVMGLTSTTTFMGQLFVAKLPTVPRFTVTFSREGISSKVVKLFKSEIRTGDAIFDEGVYVDANGDKEALASLLSDELVRNEIGMVVSAGGTVSVQGREVLWEAHGDVLPEAQIAALIEAAIGT